MDNIKRSNKDGECLSFILFIVWLSYFMFSKYVDKLQRFCLINTSTKIVLAAKFILAI